MLNRLAFGITILLLALMASDCGLRSPKVKESFVQAEADHARFTASCSSCHEDTRPAPTLNVAHGFGRDCAECHKFDAQTLWQPLPFSHSPDPEACMGCHANDRPDTETHPKTGDCVTCHEFLASPDNPWEPTIN
jgi:hypothetical protein